MLHPSYLRLLLKQLNTFTQNIFAAIRPTSPEKPLVASMRSRGVTIHLVDQSVLSSSPPNAEFIALVSVLRSIDTAIAVADSTKLALQMPLIDACKEAGVKRFIPCDTATACVKGVMQLYDKVSLYFPASMKHSWKHLLYLTEIRDTRIHRKG